MVDLINFLERQKKELGGLRALARKTGVSHNALSNLMTSETAIPELETLVRISQAFGMPLWRIIDLAGFDLGLPRSPSDQAQRLAGLVEQLPEFQPIVSYLLSLQPDDLEGVLTYLESLNRRRGRTLA